ncbi:hypothetical protein GCM10017557_26740 [Streptomyces aurantiacus]|uniref:Uncharacterized protein n=1 Tax=Streptomyces aurantiacus TaxID=47760 RepID=A0A7G1P413_9ACTN|nr:hypothetical protein GCM10017557_26740 [Streptomyces aurantiacus]
MLIQGTGRTPTGTHTLLKGACFKGRGELRDRPRTTRGPRTTEAPPTTPATPT